MEPSYEVRKFANDTMTEMTPSPPSDVIERLRLMSLSVCGEAASRLQELVSENARLREALRQVSQFRGQVGLYEIEKNGNLATAVAIAEGALAAQEKQK